MKEVFNVMNLIKCQYEVLPKIDPDSYVIRPKPLKGTLYVSFDNLGFISGQVRVRGKGRGEYPFHYLEMVDYVFGREENTIEVCSGNVNGRCFTVDVNPETNPQIVDNGQTPAKVSSDSSNRKQSIYNESLLKLKELKKLSGELEIDEALFGGHRKGKRGWGSEGKNLVFGIYQRNGKVITFPVSDRKHNTLIPLIKLHTKKDSLYYTDDHTAYAALNLIGKHQIILHGKEEYVRDDSTHINGIEGFWSYAKTWLYRYRGVPKSYFDLYLKEIEFRFNHRNEDIFRILIKMMIESVPNS